MKNGIFGIILAAHKLWLDDHPMGARADLSRAVLRGADLSDADLRGAVLRRADLSGAVLSDADLRRADLRHIVGSCGSEMTCLQDRWNVVMTRHFIAIGCQQHEATKWWDFSDDEIDKMDDEALEWWRTRKPILKALHEAKFGN